MKCPQCGEETSPGKACGRCGSVLPHRKDVEVEYREFKVSEVLDIKMVKNGGETSSGEEALPKEGTDVVSGTEAKRAENKSRFFIIAAIVIALAIIGGLYLSGFFEGF